MKEKIKNMKCLRKENFYENYRWEILVSTPLII